ncbi:MAG: PIN domain nuclease [Ramlibacter sp.]|nr:PIN domain nuclease [Ramlibacter sp.]
MIADTSAWIEMLRASGSAADMRLKQALLKRQRLLMPDVVYQELLQGVPSPQKFMALQAQLDAVPAFLPADARETARQAAMLYARCRWQGITIRSPNDCLIAACAIEAGEPLLHADRDFERIAAIEPRLRLA